MNDKPKDDRPSVGQTMKFSQLPKGAIYKKVSGGIAMTTRKVYGTKSSMYTHRIHNEWKVMQSGCHIDDEEEVEIVGYVDE